MTALLLQQQTRPVIVGDAWRYWSASQIAAILGSPVRNVQTCWPVIYAELEARGVGDFPVQVAALATVGVESGTFLPIAETWWLPEYAREAYHTRLYEGRSDLGNVVPGDGHRFCGRGWIQITGRANYTSYGQRIGVDLVGDPDLALDPSVAAKIFAVYFQNHRSTDGYNVADAARAGLWRLTRLLVNGGYAGWGDYVRFVENLQAARQA